MLKYTRYFWMLLLALLAVPTRAQQADVRWLERTTTAMSILYPAGSEAEAERYAAFADIVYREVTDSIGYAPAPPLTLRIYPTMEVYQQVNPLAQTITGVVAHAHTGRREISIAVPQMLDRTDEEVRNVVRHELVHIIAAELSGGNLSTMWQEGIAQYVERPAPELETKIALLQQAQDRDLLASWSVLDQPGAMYANPQLGYPQSWSMVAFLVQRYGMPAFVNFMQTMQTAGGYRSALQQTYGFSADVLEAEWQAQLPTWLAGGWRTSAASFLDLDSIRTAIDAGRYSEAALAAESARAAATDPLMQEQVTTLLTLANAGLAADEATTEARAALERGDYTAVQAAIERARPLYSRLQRNDMTAILDLYAARADDGLRARDLLDRARTDLRGLRWASARRNLDQAALLYGKLGDQAGRNEAQTLLDSLNRRMRWAAVGLLVIVGLGIAWNIDRRRSARQRALPFG